MHQYRWAIAFIAITFLALALADLHNVHIGTACKNAEGQLVACADLQQPRVPPASQPDSTPAGARPGTWLHVEGPLLALGQNLGATSGSG